MFNIVPITSERTRAIYQSKEIANEGSVIYAIKLDKVNDQEYYFTFSYIHKRKAEEIAKKLWADGHNFYQDVNRTHDPQLTLISSLE